MRPILYKILARGFTNPQRAKIAPFPGKYPTRVYWRVSLRGRKHPVSYLGKPVKLELLRFLALMLSGNVTRVRAVEFDRELQLVAEYADATLGNTPVHHPELITPNVIRNVRRNTALCHLYHPTDHYAMLFGCLATTGTDLHTKVHAGIRLAWYQPKGYKQSDYWMTKYLAKVDADLAGGYLWK